MFPVVSITGHTVNVDEYRVAVLNGPYPNDNGPHTYIYSMPPSVLVTTEPAASVAARIPAGPKIVRLTRPDGTPVWINAQYVTQVRAPLWTENPPPHSVHAVLMVGPLHHAVIEDVPTVHALLGR
jgi:hypothetical protein